MARSKLTIGHVALRLGCLHSQIDTLCRRGQIPFEMAGRVRVFDEAHLPEIRDVAIRAGYLSQSPIHA